AQVISVGSYVAEVVVRYDTVIMNPPYGTRSPHLDVRFLERAFELAPVSYSIHKSSTREYLNGVIAKKNRRVDALRNMTLNIPHLFPSHHKKWHTDELDLY